MLISHGDAVDLGASILRFIRGTSQYVVKDGKIVDTLVGNSTNLLQVHVPGVVPVRYVQYVPTEVNIIIVPCRSFDSAYDFLRRAIQYINESGVSYKCRLNVTQDGYNVQCVEEDFPDIPINAGPMRITQLKRLCKAESKLPGERFSCIIHDTQSIVPLSTKNLTMGSLGITAKYINVSCDSLMFIDRGRLRAKNWRKINISSRWDDTLLINSCDNYPRDALFYPSNDECSFCQEVLHEGYLLHGAPMWGCFYVKSCDICAGTLTSHGEWKRKKCEIYKFKSDPDIIEKQDVRTRELLGLNPGTDLRLEMIEDGTYAGPDILISYHDLPELTDVLYRRGQKYTIADRSVSAILA